MILTIKANFVRNDIGNSFSVCYNIDIKLHVIIRYTLKSMKEFTFYVMKLFKFIDFLFENYKQHKRKLKQYKNETYLLFKKSIKFEAPQKMLGHTLTIKTANNFHVIIFFFFQET